MEENKIITFNKQKLQLVWGTYSSTNNTSLELITEKGEPYIYVTVNIEHVDLDEKEIVVKNYSENEGIMQTLIKEEIIAKPHETIKSGYVELYICEVI